MALKCKILGHYYLPKKKMAMHYSGVEKEVDYLECSRCGQQYVFIFHEYWHLREEQQMWEKANLRKGLISQEVEQQLQNVVENFPFEAAVRQAASKAIDEAISEYFNYGPGYETIKGAVEEALDKAFKGGINAKTGE